MNYSLSQGGWPLYKVLLACTFTGAFTFALSHQFKQSETPKPMATVNCTSHMDLLRLKEYKLIQPLLLTDIGEESEDFNELKTDLSSTIYLEKSNGVIQDVAVYIRDFTDGSWMGINYLENYDPGSILKLPILLAYLKNAKSNPALLDHKLTYNGPGPNMPKQNIVSSTLQIGKSYTIRELLRFMIVDSDNQANALLNNYIEPNAIIGVFKDLNTPIPDMHAQTFQLNAKDISKFLRVLYNSSYTTPELSEYALDLLTKVTFKDGMRQSIPENIVMAHKFGERGYSNSKVNELHETSIIYLEGRPILLTILTRGTNQLKQAAMIRNLTKISFDHLTKKTTTS